MPRRECRILLSQDNETHTEGIILIGRRSLIALSLSNSCWHSTLLGAGPAIQLRSTNL